MKISIRHIILLVLMAGACAPKVDDRPDSGARFDFGPDLQDVTLDLSNLDQAARASGENWAKVNDTQAVSKLEFLENIYALGTSFNSSILKSSAISSVRKFRQDHQPVNILFENSPYLEAIVGFSEQDAVAQVTEAEKFLKEDTQKVRAFLESTVATYPWPNPPMKAELALEEIQKYLNWFMAQLPNLNVDPMIVEAIESDIPVRAVPKLKKVMDELVKIRASQTSLDAVQSVNNLIAVMEYELSGQNAFMMKQGKILAEMLKSASSDQDILTILIKIHRIVAPETSKRTLGKEAPELYEFITNVSDVESRLKCMEGRSSSECSDDGYGYLAKKLKILPEIKKMGVANLKNKIDTAMRDYLFAAVDEEVVLGARSIPGMLSEEIQKGSDAKMVELGPIKNDFKNFVKTLAKGWSRENLPTSQGQIRGLEQLSGSTRESGADIIGQGLIVKTQLLNTAVEQLSPEERIEWSLEHVNKLLALGGYKKSENETARPITQPLDVKQTNRETGVEEMITSTISFAVPDRISLASAYTTQDGLSAANVSVSGQARLLKGLAESIRFLRDWDQSSYDKILAPVTIGQIYSGAPESIASKKIFPKDTLIALSIGNAAVILKNLLKELSPVFVLIEENRIIWANRYDSQFSSPSALAGVVSLVNGKRDTKVLAKDISQYIVALVDFYNATEGVDQTKSEKLPVKDLLEARSQIKLLVLGLANFLSNKMKGADGWIHEGFSVKEGKIENGAIQMMTQFRALSAMIKAYELTGLSPYRWTIMDLYYKLNKDGFDAKKAFYKNIETLDEGVEALRTLKSLEPLLTSDSGKQLTKLATTWFTLVENRLK